MISHRCYGVDPWAIRENFLDLGVLAQSESVFALANGHIGLRANLDEGEPHGLPGTYLNSVYEVRPLPYAEAGYGYPESGQAVINVTNGKLIRLLVNDEPFDVRYGTVDSHERVLDLRAGVLRRVARWTSPSGFKVEVTSTRLVSFVHRSIAAIEYQVRPVDAGVQVVVQSELVANEQLPSAADDPRASSVLHSPLVPEHHATRDLSALLVHRTCRTGIVMAAAMEHTIEGTAALRHETVAHPDLARTTVTELLHPGEKLRIVKYLAYGWSSRRSNHSVRSQVRAALAGARHTGFEGLLEEQRAHLERFWAQADVELEGSAQLQQARRALLLLPRRCCLRLATGQSAASKSTLYAS